MSGFIVSLIIVISISSLIIVPMILICRPLDHQFDWEKKIQGDNEKSEIKDKVKRK